MHYSLPLGSWAGAGNQQIAAGEGRCGHVAHHVGIEPPVHQPHGQSLQHQLLTPHSVTCNATRAQNFRAHAFNRFGLCARKHSANFADRLLGEGVETAVLFLDFHRRFLYASENLLAQVAFDAAVDAAFSRYIRCSNRAQSFWSGGAGEVQVGPSTAGRSIFSPVTALNQNTR